MLNDIKYVFAAKLILNRFTEKAHLQKANGLFSFVPQGTTSFAPARKRN